MALKKEIEWQTKVLSFAAVGVLANSREEAKCQANSLIPLFAVGEDANSGKNTNTNNH